MKLANVEWRGRRRLALVVGDEVIDLSAQLGDDVHDLSKLWKLGDDWRTRVDRCARTATHTAPTASVTFRSPLAQADKILGVGMNYRSFAAAAQSAGVSVPEDRIWFLRPRGCVAGPHDDIWLPAGADDLDYEGELAVVIGARCRRASAEQARRVVAGFTVANDLTLRKSVLRSPVLGKSFDTHMPIGPWIVTPDEIGDPHRLRLRTWVNGELRQESSTSDMIAGCYELVAEINAACTLNPGDVLLTGTPAGCGAFRNPPTGLAAGDVVRVEIDGIGAIENRVIDEPAG